LDTISSSELTHIVYKGRVHVSIDGMHNFIYKICVNMHKSHGRQLHHVRRPLFTLSKICTRDLHLLSYLSFFLHPLTFLRSNIWEDFWT
jgi:hypothetical protein